MMMMMMKNTNCLEGVPAFGRSKPCQALIREAYNSTLSSISLSEMVDVHVNGKERARSVVRPSPVQLHHHQL